MRFLIFIKTILFTPIAFLSYKGYCQDNRSYTQNFTTHSPNAFSFSKIDNTPMNLFTGQISPTIPIYEKSLSLLKLKMSFNYLGGGGIKVSDLGSSYGKGWHFDFGGIIIRNKRGVPDDYKNRQTAFGSVPTRYNGVLFNEGVNYMADGTQRISYSDPTFNYADGTADAQHDIFEFNIQGRSGKFYIGKNREIILVPYSKLKIIPDFTNSTKAGGEISSFLIIDEAGIKYYFNNVQVTIDKDGSDQSIDENKTKYFYKEYVSSWLLSKIESPFNEESISFEYYESPVEFYGIGTGVYSKRSDWSTENFSNSGDGQSSELNIKSIVFSDQTKINFNYYHGRYPFGELPMLLKKIEILNNQQQIINSYSLNYLTWMDNNQLTFINPHLDGSVFFYLSKRNRFYLESVYQNSTDGKIIPSFAFTYYLGPNFNDLTFSHRSEDFWGYFNGKDNASPFTIPTLNYPAANREPDLNYAKRGALQSITYSTHGSEEFEYELNDKKGINGNIAVGGLRIKKRVLRDAVNPQNNIIKEYKYVDEISGLSSGFLGETPEFAYRSNVYHDNGGWPNNPNLKYYVTIALSTPANPLSSIEGSYAGYKRVEEWQHTGTVSNGKKVYEYSDLTYTDFWYVPDYYPYRPVDRANWAVGLPLRVTDYSSTGVIIKQIINEYNIVQSKLVNDNFRSLFMSKAGEVDVAGGNGGLLRFIYKFNNYYPIVGRAELTATHEYIYPTTVNTPPIYTLKQFTYDPNYYLLKSSMVKNSKGQILQDKLYYPFDYNLGSSSFTTKMVEKNMLNEPISTEKWVTQAGSSFFTSGQVTQHSILSNGIIRPEKLYQSRMTSPIFLAQAGSFNGTVLLPPTRNLQQIVQFTKYDDKGRLVEYEKEGGFKSAIIIDESGNINAKAENSNHNRIAYTSFEAGNSGNWNFAASGVLLSEAFTGTKSFKGGMNSNVLPAGNYIVTLWAKGNGSVTVNGISQTVNNSWNLYEWKLSNITTSSINSNGNIIDEVRLYPQEAQITTYTYNQSYGIASASDAKGSVAYYEYDEFNRLKNLKDQNGDIIKNLQYNHKAPYINDVKTGTFTANCPPEYVPGPPQVYTVPAGKYISTISQANADAKAQSDVYMNGQKYVDANRICYKLYYSNEALRNFTRNNCPAGTVTRPVLYIVEARKYTSTISQADADAKAEADLNANGQNYANANGVCRQTVKVDIYNSTSKAFIISFSGIYYDFPPGASLISVPVNTYSVDISQMEEDGMYTFTLGSRSSVVWYWGSFSNVNIAPGSLDNYISVSK